MPPTPPPYSNRKSLAGQVLAELLGLSSSLGEMRGEMRTKHQWTMARITALEQRMDTVPPPLSPRGSWLGGALTALGTAWRIMKLAPWKWIAGAASLFGGTAWNWLLPLIHRLSPWPF